MTEIKWAHRRGGYIANAADRSGRAVRVVVRCCYEEWQWRAYEAGSGADGPPPRELASGIEDSLRDAKYAAECWLARC